jgi:hypothetical protein
VDSIQTILLNLLPYKRKQTASGWISFNAVCCHHRGHAAEKKQRGGLRLDGEGFVYHCFNCGFKAGWQPGKQLSSNTQQLLSWLGLDATHIGHLKLLAMKSTHARIVDGKLLDFTLEPRELPPQSNSIVQLLESGNYDTDLVDCAEYVLKRGLQMDWYPWYWSSDASYRRRLIVPFYYQGKTVGWTARKIDGGGKTRYLTTSQPGYVFNLDAQSPARAYVLVVEGQLDAVALDAVSVMGRTVNAVQAARINALGKQVVVVPDRDGDGADLIRAALQYGWAISLPPWQSHVKDVADAQQSYGRCYTLWSIINHIETNPVKQKLAIKQLEKLKTHGQGN